MKCLGIVFDEDLLTGTDQTKKKRCFMIQGSENAVTPPEKSAGNIQRLCEIVVLISVNQQRHLPDSLVSKKDSYKRLCRNVMQQLCWYKSGFPQTWEEGRRKCHKMCLET